MTPIPTAQTEVLGFLEPRRVLGSWVAVAVLLIVMHWFFHKLYWGGWICLHTRKSRKNHFIPGGII